MMHRFMLGFKSIVMLSVLAATTFAAIESAWALSPEGEGRRDWLKYNCYGCHGMRAGGGMGPNVAHETEDLREVVMRGAGEGMPSYSLLVNDTDIVNLGAYLRSIGTPSEPLFLHWWEAVPTQ